MKLSHKQLHRFWREWAAACRAQGWTDRAQMETERHNLLARAGFTSLTLVDPSVGLDRLLAELASLSRPNDIAPQLRAQAMPRTRLLYSIGHAGFSPAYIAAILRDLYGHQDLDRLSLDDLRRLAITLANRARSRKKRGKPISNQPF
jgi:hypothetical protein